MEISSPKITDHSGPSLVWLIPLVSALVGGWLIVKTLSEQGPEATISFHTADGIELGKTKIKYKNVDIGEVDGIQFSDDFSHVTVTVKFNHGTESFLRRDTRFWVVKPQFGLRGISGLSTLISGAYIEIEPGQGAPQFHFVGLETQPVLLADERGKRIVLITNRLGSIDIGSPVSYQGLLAGEVLGYELANDQESIYIHVFIKDPFDQLVKENSRFWNVSGIDISMGADGLTVRTESVQSLLFGGIAFETPASLIQPSDDIGDLIYTLHDDYGSIEKFSFTKKINYIAYFNSTVRGLSIGAPVEFQGIRVGSVLDIRLEYDNSKSSFRIPVLIEIEPERFIHRDLQQEILPFETMNTLIENGLRARLQSGSLLTGQLFVDLSMHPDSEVILSGQISDIPEIPTIDSVSLDSITLSLDAFVSELDTLNISEIGRELLGTLEGTNKLFNAPEVQESVDELESSLQSLSSILKKIENSNLDEILKIARTVLQNLDQTLLMMSRVLQPNSPLQYNLIQMTSELEETARSIRALVETLERNPQSLIFGKDTGGNK